MHALLSYVAASDVRIASRVRGWLPPRWFCVAMLVATRFGDGWGWAALVLPLATDGARGRMALLAALVAGALSIGVFTVLKRAFKRSRPCAGESHTLFDLRPPDRFSFPSGHTMAAFAVSATLGLQYPHLSPLLILVAVSIALSRVVLGLHYVSDVVAGALVGTMLGWAASVAVA